MINRFEKLLEVLPTSSHVWLEDAKVNQDLESINIQHWEADPVWTHTGTTTISKDGDKIMAFRKWARGSFPVAEDEISLWLSRLEEVYVPQLALLHLPE